MDLAAGQGTDSRLTLDDEDNRAYQAYEASSDEPTRRIPVWNTLTKKKAGEEGWPMAQNLQEFLKRNPHCEVYAGQTQSGVEAREPVVSIITGQPLPSNLMAQFKAWIYSETSLAISSARTYTSSVANLLTKGTSRAYGHLTNNVPEGWDLCDSSLQQDFLDFLAASHEKTAEGRKEFHLLRASLMRFFEFLCAVNGQRLQARSSRQTATGPAFRKLQVDLGAASGYQTERVAVWDRRLQKVARGQSAPMRQNLQAFLDTNMDCEIYVDQKSNRGQYERYHRGPRPAGRAVHTGDSHHQTRAWYGKAAAKPLRKISCRVCRLGQGRCRKVGANGHLSALTATNSDLMNFDLGTLSAGASRQVREFHIGQTGRHGGVWTPLEDDQLRAAVATQVGVGWQTGIATGQITAGSLNWTAISSALGARTDVACRSRFEHKHTEKKRGQGPEGTEVPADAEAQLHLAAWSPHLAARMEAPVAVRTLPPAATRTPAPTGSSPMLSQLQPDLADAAARAPPPEGETSAESPYGHPSSLILPSSAASPDRTSHKGWGADDVSTHALLTTLDFEF